jgi:cytochrome c oxidase assembly protein subunit 15
VTKNVLLHRFAVFTAASTFLLIIAGALVTSNDAGLSVPDWPLSYGTWMPPMVGGIFYEHGHRMVASFVGFLTISLAVWLTRAEDRRWVKYLGWAALGSVILQGVLGGLTVLFLLPAAVSVGHACLAQLFFCMVVSLAVITSPDWRRRQERSPSLRADESSPTLRHLCLAVNGAILLQLALGAAFRHKAFGIVPHLAGAALVTMLVFWVMVRSVSRHSDEPRVFGWALGLNGMLMLQLILGAAAYWIRQETGHIPQPMPLMVVLTVMHVAAGAVLLASSVVLSIQAHALLPAEPALTGKPEVAVTT